MTMSYCVPKVQITCTYLQERCWCPSYGACLGMAYVVNSAAPRSPPPVLQPNRSFYFAEIHVEVLARESVRVMAQLRTRLKHTVSHSLPVTNSF